MDYFDLSNYSELRVKTEAYYRSIGSVDCKALKAKVNFNAEGLHHFKYNGSGKERGKQSQYNKFFLF